MKPVTFNLALILVLILGGCTNGSSTPKKSNSTTSNTSGSLLTTGGSSSTLFTAPTVTWTLTEARYAPSTNSSIQNVVITTNLGAKITSEHPQNSCGTNGCVCEFNWIEPFGGVDLKRSALSPAQLLPSVPNSVRCDLPSFMANEALSKPSLRASFSVQIKSIPDHSVTVKSKSPIAASSTLFTGLDQIPGTSSNSDKDDFYDVYKTVCYPIFKRSFGLMPSLQIDVEYVDAPHQTLQNSYRFSESMPLLSTYRTGYHFYDRSGGRSDTEGYIPQNSSNTALPNAGLGIITFGFTRPSNFNLNWKDPGTYVDIAQKDEWQTKTYPISLYTTTRNLSWGNGASKSYHCMLSGGSRIKFAEFALKGGQSAEYSVPVAARSCIGTDCAAPTANPCVSGSAAVGTNDGSPIRGCLGFAKNIDSGNRCEMDTSNKQTYRLRKYIALYPLLFDANGYPIPLMANSSGQSRPAIVYDEIYVLDRRSVSGGISTGEHQKGPLPCPFKLSTSPIDHTGTTINTWKLYQWNSAKDFKSFNASYLPREDNAILEKSVQNGSRLNHSFDKSAVESPSCAMTLPIPTTISGKLKLGTGTLSVIDPTTQPNLHFALKSQLAKEGLLVRPDMPFQPIFVEDTSFVACARPPAQPQSVAPISILSATSGEQQSCANYYADSSDADEPKPVAAGTTDFQDGLSANPSVKSPADMAAHQYRCRVTQSNSNINARNFGLSTAACATGF